MEYAYLGKSGVKVSRVLLGCMTFGGEGTDEPEARRILDRYVDAGGNYLDTANNYQGAEEILGHWLRERGCRKDVVLGTKVRFPVGKGPNDVGLSRKHIMDSVEESLRRLQTDHIDLYQAHCWDADTGIEETLRAFDDPISAGKVRLIGCSNFASWHLMKALARSEMRGWAKFVNVQNQYSLMTRTADWEVLPLCREENVGFTCWSPLAIGWLSGKYRRDSPPPAESRLAHAASTPEEWKRLLEIDLNATIPHPHRIESEQQFQELRKSHEAERRWQVIDSVGDVAKERGKTHSQVALRWILDQPGVTGPVIGVRTLAQLEDNLGAVDWKLADEEKKWLDQVSDPGLPYPHDFFKQYGVWR